MANPFPSLQSFAVGDLDYITKLNTNFGIVDSGGDLIDGRLAALEGASSIAATVDAIANIPNLCVNGDFRTTFCGPRTRTSNYAATVPVLNGTHGTELVQWADCWYVKPDQVDALLVENTDSTYGTGIVPDPFLDGIRISQGAAVGSPYTGVVFQRLDYFYDLTLMRDRSMVFSVRYTAATANEFHLEVDDGVAVSSSSLNSLGSATLRVAHTIDSAATKLVVRIVLDKDAVTGANALMIHFAHARLGVAYASLTAQTPPPKQPFEMWLAQMFTFTAEYNSAFFPEVWDNVATSNCHEIIQLRVPFVIPDSDDYEAGIYLAPAGVDPRDIGVLAAPPTLSFTQIRRYGPNYQTAPTPLVFSALCEKAIIKLVRTMPPDVLINPITGFYTDEMVAMARIIPNV